MKIYIKNMVCDRCILVVMQALENLDLKYLNIELGEIEFASDLGGFDSLEAQAKALHQLSDRLASLGFVVLGDKKSQWIEGVKKACRDYLVRLSEPDKIKLSEFVEGAVPRDYTYLSNLFSSVEGVTIEHYFISLRVEKAKELLVYDELSLKEIAFQLGYSSAAHFSTQFKKTTGLSPSYFRELKSNKLRRPIDNL